MLNTTQTATTNITTSLINLDKIQDDTFIVLTVEEHFGHLHLTTMQFCHMSTTKKQES